MRDVDAIARGETETAEKMDDMMNDSITHIKDSRYLLCVFTSHFHNQDYLEHTCRFGRSRSEH